MKKLFKISCLVFLAILLAECDAPRKALITLNSEKEGKVEKVKEKDSRRDRRDTEARAVSTFELGYKSIQDRETRYMWEPYYDNPSSMYRFIMEEQSSNKRLPRIFEMTEFFDKVIRELEQNGGSELASQLWLHRDGDYITSSEMITPENKKLFQGIRWNYYMKEYEIVNLASGDLVYILLITQQ